MTAGHTSPRRRLVLVAGSTLLALFAVEVGLRVRGALRPVQAVDDPRDVRAAIEAAGVPAPGEVAQWGQTIRAHPDDALVYENALHLDTQLAIGGAIVHLRTNGLGMRGAEVRADFPADGLRVLGLGDSIMFGHGVEEADTYLARLAGELRARAPLRAVEVLNAAVCGYDARQEVETLKRKGLALEPDIVLLGVCENDFDHARSERPDPLAFDRSWLLTLVFGGEDERRLGPKRYDSSGFEEALRELHGLATEHGFRTLVFSVEPSSAASRMVELARDEGLDAVDLSRRLRKLMRRAGVARAEFRGSPFTVSAENGHPSELLHGHIAEWLAEELAQRGWLGR